MRPNNLHSILISYLGLPCYAKFKDKKIWQGIIDKMEKKLSPWKKQYLFFGGGLTPVKSVLDGILDLFNVS